MFGSVVGLADGVGSGAVGVGLGEPGVAFVVSGGVAGGVTVALGALVAPVEPGGSVKQLTPLRPMERATRTLVSRNRVFISIDPHHPSNKPFSNPNPVIDRPRSSQTATLRCAIKRKTPLMARCSSIYTKSASRSDTSIGCSPTDLLGTMRSNGARSG